jgi:hypothetical protein
MSAPSLYEHVCATPSERTSADVLATWVVIVFSIYAIAGLLIAFFAVCAAVGPNAEARAKPEAALRSARPFPTPSGSTPSST